MVLTSCIVGYRVTIFYLKVHGYWICCHVLLGPIWGDDLSMPANMKRRKRKEKKLVKIMHYETERKRRKKRKEKKNKVVIVTFVT